MDYHLRNIGHTIYAHLIYNVLKFTGKLYTTQMGALMNLIISVHFTKTNDWSIACGNVSYWQYYYLLGYNFYVLEKRSPVKTIFILNKKK